VSFQTEPVEARQHLGVGGLRVGAPDGKVGGGAVDAGERLPILRFPPLTGHGGYAARSVRAAGLGRYWFSQATGAW
jgi:hypothetical protein